MLFLTSRTWFFGGGEDIQQVIDKAYDWYIINEGTHASLVVAQWPVICIRSNQKFGNVLVTFAHEVQHLVSDHRSIIDFRNYSSERNFIEQELYRSGGEFEAFQVSARFQAHLQSGYNWNSFSRLMNFFDVDGNLEQPEAFETFILDELNYRKIFSSYYRDIIHLGIASLEEDLSAMEDFLQLYTDNAEIMQGNIEVSLNNIETYQKAIRFYEKVRDETKLAEMKEGLVREQASLKRARKGHNFYSNLTTLAEAQISKLQTDILIE